ncbi:MAG: helix-turn-helix domain-containing protein [Pseudomonadales bacterium]|nr:helix-turn-helix domain-containing protein [Pseudomonadales bacterium]
MQDQLFFSAVYTRLLLRSGIEGLANFSPDQLLAGTELTVTDLEQRDYLAWPDVRRMLANIAVAGAAPDWPLRFAQSLTLASHGPMGFTALSAPTLADALAILAEYHATRIATFDVELSPPLAAEDGEPGNRRAVHQARRYRIVLRELTGDERYGRQALEMAIVVLLSLVETIVGHPLMHNVQVSFAYPETESSACVASLLGVECSFSAQSNEITLPSSWLQIASPLYDAETYRANLLKCREQLSALLRIKRDPAQWVRQHLAQAFDAALVSREQPVRLPGLADCAVALNMSPRTLLRRLSLQHSTYKSLLEQIRKDYAANLLRSTHLTVAEIGMVLGYADTANFIRAFRRWHNSTPAAWRKANRTQAGLMPAVK